MKFKCVAALLTCLAIATSITGVSRTKPPNLPTAPKTISERLGYPADAKLLIVHADDLGMAHSVNLASIEGLESGLVTSASIMIPCPWLPEIATYARNHPQADLGLHLTLTSEWTLFRWGPVLPKEQVPSLFDNTGYFYSTETEAAAHINPKEAEAEIRAQIARAKALGIQPTHLDSHMGTLYQNQALFETFLRVARENNLVTRIAKQWLTTAPFLPALLSANDVVINDVISIEPRITAEHWRDYYADAIKNLQPGITEVIVHLAYDNEEMRGLSFDHPNWGAAWRQRDFEFVTSQAFRKLLQENNVKLVTWREVANSIKKS
ncbi:MAG: polysaccharide deacetylase family protein [Pyrinomonadaceae bacterium]